MCRASIHNLQINAFFPMRTYDSHAHACINNVYYRCAHAHERVTSATMELQLYSALEVTRPSPREGSAPCARTNQGTTFSSWLFHLCCATLHLGTGAPGPPQESQDSPQSHRVLAGPRLGNHNLGTMSLDPNLHLRTHGTRKQSLHLQPLHGTLVTLTLMRLSITTRAQANQARPTQQVSPPGAQNANSFL